MNPTPQLRVAWFSLLLVGPACQVTAPVDGWDSGVGDADGDGYNADVDCDDAQAAVHPDADEVCDGADNDCDGAVDEDPIDGDTWYTDTDGDGWGAAETGVVSCNAPSGAVDNGADCDDGDSGTAPNRTEICDEVDNDCDGLVDEDDATDAEYWYVDADGDGYGSIWTRVRGCEAPATGWVEDGGDCNDLDSAINPEAQEVCDEAGVDEDCDGLPNDADASVLGDATWYIDNDDDGWGNDDTEISACNPPSGSVERGGDCDDADATLNPGTAEICGDGLDNDCDGGVDDEGHEIAWYVDSDGDGYGAEGGVPVYACAPPAGYVSNADDCNDRSAAVSPEATETWYDYIDSDCDDRSDLDRDGDGYDITDECDDGDATVNPDVAEVCGNDVDDDCDGFVDPCQIDATWAGAALGDQAGQALVAMEGLAAVGAPGADSGGASRGMVCLLASASDLSLADADACLLGANDGDALGTSVALLDLDGDGELDLLAGAPGADGGGSSSGAVWLALGPLSGTLSTSAADGSFVGNLSGDAAGTSVAAAGDVDGDGHADLLVGAPGTDTGASGAGAAYLFSGPITGADASYADASLWGMDIGARAGAAVASGDLDGDGHSDLVIGAPHGEATAGVVYVLLGPASGEYSLDYVDAWWTGEASAHVLGTALAVSDLDGDGRDEVLAGAPGDSTTWVLGLPGAGGLEDALAVIRGASDQAGAALAGPGDVDGDDQADVLVGAPSGDAAWLVLGPISGSMDLDSGGQAVLHGTAGDRTGAGLAATDLDGDRSIDLLVGAPDASSTDGDAGAVWIVLGRWW